MWRRREGQWVGHFREGVRKEGGACVHQAQRNEGGIQATSPPTDDLMGALSLMSERIRMRIAVHTRSTLRILSRFPRTKVFRFFWGEIRPSGRGKMDFGVGSAYRFE